ncbi:MAG TPA: tRNA pseudouridine(55) synthase TruB [Roseiarcus sp.]|nr:tRNA pseudouridine(55) synthase TruB [Roseiarcus sp.]
MTGARESGLSGPEARDRRRGGQPHQKRSSRFEIDGWINLDKPTGVSSTQAVGRLKFLFNARKAGHAGTLDPLASGVLPVAFGEATKTVPVVQDGAKSYRFRVRWGEESATDDAEGEIVARSERRPAPAEIESLLPRFVGAILQTPPTFSAIRIAGARAYDLAREGETFEIDPRPIHVYRLELISAEPDAAVFEAECGKGAYVRAIARDLGRALGCYGHVVELRRTRVGPFSGDAAIPLDRLPDDADLMARAILPLQVGLAEIPALAVDRSGAAILRRGQKLLLRGSAPTHGRAYVECFGTPIAFGVVEDGYFASTRVFNLKG